MAPKYCKAFRIQNGAYFKAYRMAPTVKHTEWRLLYSKALFINSDSGVGAAVSVNVENQNACKLWRASVCTFRKSRRRVTERSMAESKKRTGTSIPRRMSDFFSVLSSTITSSLRERNHFAVAVVNVENARRHNFHVV